MLHTHIKYEPALLLLLDQVIEKEPKKLMDGIFIVLGYL